MIRSFLLPVSCLSILLGGCGSTLPSFDPQYVSPTNLGQFVNDIAAEIDCELGDAVIKASKQEHLEYLPTWSAIVTLNLTVDEKSAISPGLALTNILPGYSRTFNNGSKSAGDQTIGIGLAASGAADALRGVKVSYYLDFARYFDSRRLAAGYHCHPKSAHPIEGTLGILEGLNAGLVIATLQDQRSEPFKTGGPLQVIEYHVAFDATYTAGANPTLKLIDVVANPTTMLLSASRERKDDLLITMGPSQIQDAKRPLKDSFKSPSVAVLYSNLAGQIGQAVTSGSRLGF